MSRSLAACMLRTIRFPFTVRTHATLATMTILEWLVHRILSFTVRTHATLATMTKLEWLVHRILSFTVRTRDSRNDDIDTALCGARSGSPQLLKIIFKHYQFLCGLPNRQGVAGRATMAGRDRLYAIMNSGRYGSNSTTPS